MALCMLQRGSWHRYDSLAVSMYRNKTSSTSCLTPEDHTALEGWKQPSFGDGLSSAEHQHKQKTRVERQGASNVV